MGYANTSYRVLSFGDMKLIRFTTPTRALWPRQVLAVPTAVALHDSSEVSYGVSHFFEKIKIRFEVSWVVDCRVF